MKRIIFIIPFLTSCLFVKAQSASTITNSSSSSANSINGWFEVPVPGTTANHYTLSYGLQTKPFTTQIKMSLAVTNPISDPIKLTGKIINPSGSTMVTWNGSVGSNYTYTFDISSLSVGVYHLDIYDNKNNKVCTIPFDKAPN